MNVFISIAAVMRIGLLEMKNFSMEFFSGVKVSVNLFSLCVMKPLTYFSWYSPQAETFVQESAGVADLITTCESTS